MSWQDRVPSIKAILRSHFPGANEESIARWSKEICEGNAAAQALEFLQRNDRNPEEEVKSIRDAANRVQNAKKAVEKLGNHGRNAIADLARQLSSCTNAGHSSKEVLVSHLEWLSDMLNLAATEISPDLSTGGLGVKKNVFGGAPPKTCAEFTSKECYLAFAELSGSRPTVKTDGISRGHPATGPFIELLTDVFRELSVSASSETWARHWTSQARRKPPKPHG